jgi:hypothetical protein
MTAWARGELQQYQIPSETHHFVKLSLAIALHEVDQDVLDRQDPAWLADLHDLLVAQNAPRTIRPGGPILGPAGTPILTPRGPAAQ